MSSGERPIGAAKGKQSDTEALCQPPPPLQGYQPMPSHCPPDGNCHPQRRFPQYKCLKSCLQRIQRGDGGGGGSACSQGSLPPPRSGCWKFCRSVVILRG